MTPPCAARSIDQRQRRRGFPALALLGLLTQTHMLTESTEELTLSVCEPADEPMSCRCDEVRHPGLEGGTEVTCFVVRTLSADHAIFKSLERLPSVVAITFTAFGEKYKLDFVPSVFLRRKPLLERLKFSQAELGSLKSHSFYNLSKLAILSLDSNGITELQKDSIAHLPRLKKLELGDNKLERLTTRSFTHLPLLTYLFLERNQIEVIEDLAFAGLSKLEELDLSDNAMTILTERTFEGLSQVKRLDMFRNKLRRLDARVFGAMPLLSELDLKYNEISEVDPVAFDGLAHLTVLYLSHNRLRVLPANMFVGAPNLVTVDLSQNRLLTLTWRTVEDLRKIGAESFDMSLTGNKFSCDCRLAWVLHLENATRSDKFRRELRHVKCDFEAQGNLSSSKVSRLSASQLGCSEDYAKPSFGTASRGKVPPRRPPVEDKGRRGDDDEGNKIVDEGAVSNVPDTVTKNERDRDAQSMDNDVEVVLSQQKALRKHTSRSRKSNGSPAKAAAFALQALQFMGLTAFSKTLSTCS
ncbi:connectin-like [Ixodes scapularis]